MKKAPRGAFFMSFSFVEGVRLLSKAGFDKAVKYKEVFQSLHCREKCKVLLMLSLVHATHDFT